MTDDAERVTDDAERVTDDAERVTDDAGRVTDDAERVAANRAHWDDRAAVHAASRYYDLDGILADGPVPIRGPDEAEVGDVAGKDLLHLHCHIGTGTVRWAALGARVTGVDISPGSLAVARSLAARLGLDVRFVEADVAELPAVLPEPEAFDVVYASRGVICWVPDLARWAAVAASFARPGGFVYLAESHPIHAAFDPERFGRAGYLDTGPRRFVDHRSYTDGDADLPRPENHRWAHTLGDVVTGCARRLAHRLPPRAPAVPAPPCRHRVGRGVATPHPAVRSRQLLPPGHEAGAMT